jgi:hypothetical protein
LVNSAPGGSFIRLDGKGKEVGKPLSLPQFAPIDMGGIDVIGENSVLACEWSRVAEYDLKTGKVGWELPINQPTSVQRLPNGNTLIASMNENRVIEVAPTKEIVWEFKEKDQGLQIGRAYRR